MSSQDEKTPLMDAAPPPPPSKYDSPFYFVQRSSSSAGREDSDGNRGDGSNYGGTAVVDGGTQEPGASSENHIPVGGSPHQVTPRRSNRQKKVGFFSKIFGGGSSKLNGPSTPRITNSVLRPKKTAGRVDAKIYFANERTFLAWTHTTVLLAGASIAIIAFAEANPWAQVYGVVLLPISICFIIYALVQYTRRSTMIHLRQPGPYDDIAGPLIFGAVLIVSLVADFVIKLFHAAKHS